MKLEKAIQYLKLMKMDKNNLNKVGYVYGTEAIETVLKALESYKRRYELAIEQNVKDYKNSIPKKKIEDKIQELIKIGNYRTENNPDGRIHFREEPCDYQIQVLQELLEDK